MPKLWKLVPVEPTTEMVFAGFNVTEGENRLARKHYAAMIAAAPQPPTPGLEAIETAIRTRRRELIAQPLDRIYGELALAALTAMTGGDDGK